MLVSDLEKTAQLISEKASKTKERFIMFVDGNGLLTDPNRAIRLHEGVNVHPNDFESVVLPTVTGVSHGIRCCYFGYPLKSRKGLTDVMHKHNIGTCADSPVRCVEVEVDIEDIIAIGIIGFEEGVSFSKFTFSE